MKVFLLFLGLFAVALGFRFAADIEEKDANIVGTMTGTFFYDDVSNWIRIAYNTPGAYNGQVLSITNYNNVIGDPNSRVHYLRCSGICDAESITWDRPVLTLNGDSGNAPVTIDGRTCTETVFSSNAGNPRAVHRLWTSGGAPCRAIWGSGARDITFRNVRTSGLAVPNWGAEVAGCPAKECKIRMDLIFVLDMSGSIPSGDWILAKNFVNQIIDQFEIAPLAVRVGVVVFDTSAATPIPINNYEKNSLKNQVTQLRQGGGSTCIPCGLDNAVADCNSGCRAASIFKLLIVMTDGINNVRTTSLSTSATSAKARFNLVLAIGVGPAVSDTQLTTVASPRSNQYPTTVFRPSTFSALQSLVGSIVSASCQDIPTNPCGTGCRGFCACKGTAQVRQCICASTCEDGDFCTVDSCDPLVNNAGCVYPSRQCNDGNACTDDSCSSAQSTCVYTPFNVASRCNDNSLCTTDTCDPASGCQNRRITCFDNDGCTEDNCNPLSGCVFPPISGSCDECNRFGTPVSCTQKPCFSSSCNPQNGQCVDTPIPCDDGSVCTNDTCNPATGLCVFTPISCDDNNKCTEDGCDAVTGCTHVNISNTCNDQNGCTADTCVPSIGCVYTRLPSTCNDFDNCTDDICTSTGDATRECTHLPKRCETNPFILAKLGDCYVAKCDFEIAALNQSGIAGSDGCYLEQLPNTTVDECGCCVGTDCFCGNVQPPKDQAFVVGGLALAAILLLILGLVGIAALLGGKTGYDIYLRNRGNMTGANTNPLYNAQGMAGTNPLYSTPDNA